MWASLIPLAISAYSAWQGSQDKKKAQREREKLANSRPELQNSEYLDSTNDLLNAELTAGNQTPGQVAMRQANDSAFSSSLNALLQGGGSAGNVADLFGQAQTGNMRMAVASDGLRQQNIRNLIGANAASADYATSQFKQNSWAPFADNAQAAANAYQSGNNQMWGGISSAGSALAYGGAGNGYNSYWGSGGGGGNTYVSGLQTVNSAPTMYSNTGMNSMAPTQLQPLNRTW